MNAPPNTLGVPAEELLKVRDLRKRFALKEVAPGHRVACVL